MSVTSYLSEKFVWPSSNQAFVQIIYVSGNHWACLLSVFCEGENIIDLYDSMLCDIDQQYDQEASSNHPALSSIQVYHQSCQCSTTGRLHGTHMDCLP